MEPLSVSPEASPRIQPPVRLSEVPALAPRAGSKDSALQPEQPEPGSGYFAQGGFEPDHKDPFADVFELPQHNEPQGKSSEPPSSHSSYTSPVTKEPGFEENRAAGPNSAPMSSSPIPSLAKPTPQLHPANPPEGFGAIAQEKAGSSETLAEARITEHMQKPPELQGKGWDHKKAPGRDPGQATSLPVKLAKNPELDAVAEASRRTLNQTIDSVGPPEKQARDSKYLEVYSVKGKNRKGVVLLSDYDGSRSDKKEFADFEKRLAENLRSNGADVETVERLTVRLDSTSINEVAESAGEFAYSGLHSGEEVLLTYLAGDDLVPELVEAPQNMVSVPIDSFLPDQKVDFDVYLYFSQNNKFYKYLRPGRSLSAKQIAKLRDAKMATLFVHTKDAESAKSHHLKNKIETLPQQTEKKKKIG